MLLSVLIAMAVPVAFLGLVHWLDLYGTDRPRLVIRCFGWGVAAYGLSFLLSHFFVDVLGMPKSVVGTRISPLIEEVIKALVLIELARRAWLTYVVDGAIYGFASGIGFAAIENVRYILLFADDPLAIAVVRAFSSALAHGTSTALVGIALGVFAISTRAERRLLSLLPGMAGALALHYAWNNFAYFSPFDRFTTVWILVGVGLAGLALVAATILWGLRRERAQLRESLGMDVRVSDEEASVIQHLDDLDRLLAPVAARFGSAKCAQVAELLHGEARLGCAKGCETKAVDPEWRAALAEQIAATERDIDRQRQSIGIYVMLFVRTIFPATAWSMWARLGPALAKRAPARANMWRALEAKVGSATVGGDDLYARAQRAIDTRSRIAERHVWHLARRNASL